MAAAMNPDVATLAYFVFPGQCTEPEQKVEDLVRGLVELGFSPYGFDWLLQETDGDNVLLLSVFSEQEAYHVQDLYYPLD